MPIAKAFSFPSAYIACMFWSDNVPLFWGMLDFGNSTLEYYWVHDELSCNTRRKGTPSRGTHTPAQARISGNLPQFTSHQFRVWTSDIDGWLRLSNLMWHFLARTVLCKVTRWIVVSHHWAVCRDVILHGSSLGRQSWAHDVGSWHHEFDGSSVHLHPAHHSGIWKEDSTGTLSQHRHGCVTHCITKYLRQSYSNIFFSHCISPSESLFTHSLHHKKHGTWFALLSLMATYTVLCTSPIRATGSHSCAYKDFVEENIEWAASGRWQCEHVLHWCRSLSVGMYGPSRMLKNNGTLLNTTKLRWFWLESGKGH